MIGRFVDVVVGGIVGVVDGAGDVGIVIRLYMKLYVTGGVLVRGFMMLIISTDAGIVFGVFVVKGLNVVV